CSVKKRFIAIPIAKSRLDYSRKPLLPPPATAGDAVDTELLSCRARWRSITMGQLLGRGEMDRRSAGSRRWPHLHVAASLPGLAAAARAEDPASAEKPAGPSSGLFSLWDPTTSPFIPIPEIGTDPNSGTTYGFLP